MAETMTTIRQTFFEECDELMADLESGLLQIEQGTADAETINCVFRAVHSIKGGAGALQMNALVQFSHAFETTLDHLRAGRLEPTPQCAKGLLRAADHLADLVRIASENGDSDPEQDSAIIAEIRALYQEDGAALSVEEEFATLDFDPIAVSFDDIAGDEAAPSNEAARSYTVYFQPHRSLYAKANEPGAILRGLCRLGRAVVTCDRSRLPPLANLDPEEAYLAWTIALSTDEDEAAIRKVFEFVDGDCTLEIASNDHAYETAAAVVTHEPCEAVLAGPQSAVVASACALSSKTSEAASKTAPAAPAPTTIRVDVERVDRLVDLIGELVINQAMLAQRVSEAGLARGTAVGLGLGELDRLTRGIQDSVMAIRAQPVKPVFQRMSRVVREAAEATGKRVHLATEGEDTEVDKTVIERLSDPLTHMIRNAIDHGIESPERRATAGKSPEGVVRLSALHRSGRIVIEVVDDGAGIDRPKVKEIAIRKGLVAHDAVLTDEEIDDLIFHPGFSTAESVSAISGRGVGMDVVRRSIQSLGGRISIASRVGEGSTFTLSMPLTLAVLDGMVVTIAGHTLVLPLASIVETLLPKPECVLGFGADARMILARRVATPLIDMGMRLGYRTDAADPAACIAILVESERGARVALLVDSIEDQRQIVIKSLESNYGVVPGIAAATILGDGRVALIVDIEAIVSGSDIASVSGQCRAVSGVSA